jgi:phytanoyl-CoA hydroxylase
MLSLYTIHYSDCNRVLQVCFPGTLDHLSLPNLSADPRHTYQLHLVEGPKEGVTWSGENWLQYPQKRAFPSLSVEKQ